MIRHIEDPHLLGELINKGQVKKLGRLMLVIWPPNAEWDREDIEYLVMLLRGNKNLFGKKTDHIYRAYRKRLRSHNDNKIWLYTLPIRSEIVEKYEGCNATISWLETLRSQIMDPDNGIIDLLVGGIFRAKGALNDARRYLTSALKKSLIGIEWYRLEAINEMALCLAQLSESRLAFEYARTHSIQSFILGRLNEKDLYRAIYGLALIYGEIDYLIEVKRNLVRNACKEKDFVMASKEESDVSMRLAMIGVRDEAVDSMYRAAEYAAQGSLPNEPYFDLACGLVARYLDETPLRDDEMGSLFDNSARAICNPLHMSIFSSMQKKIRGRILPDEALLKRWLSLCNQYQRTSFLSKAEWHSLFICNHLAALLGRYYTERKNETIAAPLIEVVAMNESRDAIFLFARQDYVNQLIRNGNSLKALTICQHVLAQDIPNICERFVFTKLAAQCCLALGNDQHAFAYAKFTLSDWKRIMEGLFVEEHKATWLKQGASVISCAMEILANPLSWMSEEERYLEIFDIIEQGKARMMTDMIRHSGYISGVYLLPEIIEKRADIFQVLLQEYPDWYIPLTIQGPIYGDLMTTVSHDDNGRIEKITKVNISALQSVVRLPLSPEKKLYATAQSLTFDKQVKSVGSELYDDIIQMITPRGEEV